MLDSLSRTLQANPPFYPFWERACRSLLVLLVSILLALPISGVAQTTQTLSLESGWNTVSLYVQPDDSSFATLFDGTPVSMVKSEDGEVYLPSEGAEQISAWKTDEGYKVYSKAATTLDVSGAEASPEATEIALDKGGNIVPYLSTGSQAVEQALVSIEESLVAVEDGDGVRYDPSASSSPLDSLRPGQGYEVYVDQPDTLVYPIGAETLADALSLEGVQSGQYIRTRGRDEPGDGGGGMFVVTDSACETDGGICFMFDEDLTQNTVTGRDNIPHTDLSWRSVEVEWGSEPEDVIDMRHLNGHHARNSQEPTPWIDLKTGDDTIGKGNNLLNKIDEAPTFTEFSFTYKHTNSSRRLERVNIGNSVKPEWWGAPKLDPNNPKKADSYIRWAINAALRIHDDPNNNYDRVWVDVVDGFYFLNELAFPAGTGARGVGSTNADGYTKGRLAIKPGEAQFYNKVGYDEWQDSDRERAYNQMLGKSKGVLENMIQTSGDGLEFKDLWIDGNVRNNLDVFNNPDDYEAPNGDSIFQWLQDSGDWSGFYTKGDEIVDGALLGFENVRMEDLGASGLAIGRFDDLWDIQTSNLNIKDTRRNHLLYGPTGDGLDDMTLEGQFWGGNPLSDARGVEVRSTYTNLTVKNIYTGQFSYNTVIASRGGSLDIDGFTIDLVGSKFTAGNALDIIRSDDRGNTFKNGSIDGYLPEDFTVSAEITLFKQGRASNEASTEDVITIENVTVTDHGKGMNLFSSGGTNVRGYRVVGFEYKTAEGVTGSGRLGGFGLDGSSPKPRQHRMYFEDFDWRAPTDQTFTIGAENDARLGNVPLDIFMNGGSVNNTHGYNSFTNTAGGSSNKAVARGVRLFLKDFEFRTQTEQNTENTSKWWHADLRPNNNVRLRNCTDKSGRVSENSGTYTSDAGDEGNDYVLIDPNLITHPHVRSATVTSGTPSVTSVEGADPDGTPVDGSVSSNLVDAQKHVLRINLDRPIQTGNTIEVNWSARVTPDEDFQTSGLFVAREVVSEDGSEGLSFNSGFGSSTYDLRGVASSQESWDPIVYTASSGDTSVVTANVQSDDYTLELTEQGTGTATITVTGEISGGGTATTTFEVTVE